MRLVPGVYPAVQLSAAQWRFLEQAAGIAGNPRPHALASVRSWDALAHSLGRLGLVTLHRNAGGTVVLASLTLPAPLT